MDQSARVPMDAAIVFLTSHFLQLHGSIANPIHFDHRNFPKKGTIGFENDNLDINDRNQSKFQIRSTCIALAVSFLWLLLFVIGTIFPTFMRFLGLPVCMTVLGVMSLLNAVFCYFFIPETRGKSYEQIMELLK